VQGFAYLMTKKNEVVTESARRRLEIIGAIDSLGAGFVISSEDMEIRGAGNILGESQTGHMRDVGIELYNNMLEESVENHRNMSTNPGPELDSDFYPEVKLDVQSIIPRDYIDNVNIRIKFYRKIAAIRDTRNRKEVEEELEGECGNAIPDSVHNLMDISILRTKCKHLNIQKLVSKGNEILVSFHKNVFKNPDKLLDYVIRRKDGVKLCQDSLLFYPEPGLRVIENAKRVIGILAELSS
jgi:transcription-repair coupling factor (superfamily II helicase)